MREAATIYAWITQFSATIYAWITWVIHSSSWTTSARVRRIYACSFGLLADVSQGWLDDQTVLSGLELHLPIDHDNLLQLLQECFPECPQPGIVRPELQRQR